MFVLGNMLITLFYLLFLDNRDKKIKEYSFICIVLLLTFVTGFQYKVGADYDMYYRSFTTYSWMRNFYLKGEYLFYYLIIVLKFFRIRGQGIFLVICFFQNVLFFGTLYKLYKKKIIEKYYIYIFLYFSLIGSFFMQMNLLRQYISIYILFYCVIFLFERKNKHFLVINILTYFIHKSSIFGFLIWPVYVLSKKKYNKKMYIILLVASLIIGFTNVVNDIFKEFVGNISLYSHYAESSFMTRQVPFYAKISKVIYLPLYILSLDIIFKLNIRQKIIYNMGFFFYCLRISLLFNEIAMRISEIYIFFTIFPVYYYLLKSDSKFLKLIVYFGMLAILLVKVVFFPQIGFRYASYLFN